MRFTRVSIFVALLALVIAPIAAAFAFTDASFQTPTGVTGQGYSHRFEIREGGGCPPYEYRVQAGALPPGLSLTPDGKQAGTVGGTPTIAGRYSFWIVAKDTPAACGFPATPPASTEREFTINVIPGLNILQNALNPRVAFTGQAYSFQLTAEGGGAQTWSVNSGAPPARHHRELQRPRVRNADRHRRLHVPGSSHRREPLGCGDVQHVGCRPAEADGRSRARGDRPALHLQAGRYRRQAGLQLVVGRDSASRPSVRRGHGANTGTPSATGKYALKLTMRDVLANTQTVDVNLVVAPKLLITKGKLKGATVGSSYKARFRATGGVTPRHWILLGGRPGFLPAGIKLDRKTGELSGTPKKAGTYYLRMQVVDKLGGKSAAGFVLRVNG